MILTKLSKALTNVGPDARRNQITRKKYIISFCILLYIFVLLSYIMFGQYLRNNVARKLCQFK